MRFQVGPSYTLAMTWRGCTLAANLTWRLQWMHIASLPGSTRRITARVEAVLGIVAIYDKLPAQRPLPGRSCLAVGDAVGFGSIRNVANDTMREGAAGAYGANAWLVEEMYEAYLADPTSVSESWREFFADYRSASRGGSAVAVEAAADDAAVVETDSGGDSGRSATDDVPVVETDAGAASAA